MKEQREELIMVIGPGMMGTGIAELCAISGYRVILAGRRECTLQKGIALIAEDFSGFAEEGFLTEQEAEAAQKRIRYTLSIGDGYDADYVIETIQENLAAKQSIFRELDANCPPSTILASDTSTLSITSIASAVSRRERVVGMHFFTCVPKNKLLEVIRGADTSEETLSAVRQFAAKTGKTMVVAQDSAGFIVNRLQCRLWNEAAALVQEGSTPADVDLALLHTVRPNWGILGLVDFCGLELMTTISDLLWNHLKTQRYRPCPLMKKMLELGWGGKAAGRGFYCYDLPPADSPEPSEALELQAKAGSGEQKKF